MAKYKKVMPPRNTVIRGQDHLLAYITPDEAQLLMDNGGAGKPGPMGIPAFYGDGGLGGDDVGDGTASDGMGDSQGEGSDTGEEAGGYGEVGAPAGYSDPADPDTGGFDIDVDSEPGFGSKGGALDRALQSVFDSPYSSVGIMGRALDDMFGLGTRGHTGVDTSGDGPDYMPTLKPRNPATGQCDVGYVFDPDMQACRLDTMGARLGSGLAAAGLPAMPSPGGYARMGLLDVAPTGLPQFAQQYGTGFGTPSGFADANLAFRRQGAYRPQNFQNPYPTTGYTLLS